MNKRNFFRIIILLAFSFIFSACYKGINSNTRIYLDKDWKYSQYGEPYSFYDFPVEKLSDLSSFLDTKIGYIFIKTSFYLPENFKHKDLALYIGRVKIASKLYINNHSIGKIGSLPPHEFTEGNSSFAFKIPSEYLNFGETNTLMICLWCHGYGYIDTIPYIGEYSEAKLSADYDSLIYSKIYLIFTVILLIISLIYLFLFILRKSEKENLTFSLLCLFTGIYLCIFYFGEYSFLNTINLSYLQFEKFFKGVSALITGYLIVSFTRDFLHYHESVRGKITRFCITFTATIFPLSASNIPDFRSRLRIGFLFIIIQFIFSGKIIYQAYKNKDKKLTQFIFCLVPFLLAFTSQIIAKLFFKQKIDTLLLAISWIAVIFLFLGILIMRFVQLANEVEYMNKNLENLVADRTEALEKEKNRALQEIDLAGFVQKSFYKVDTSEVTDWDIRLTSKPMAGVSGDLYVFFISNGHLDGLGIFDISGHGIASGLVTMLVKNIIEQEFHKGFKKPLVEVMTRINQRIIIEKGNIENYLTGMILRFTGKNIELVNAGHPKAILYSSKTGIIKNIEQEGKNQFGTIGIPDFPVNFETIEFTLEKNDELILYTDGITECMNKDRKSFGIEGIFSVIENNIHKNLDIQINAMPQALFDFSGSENLNDDITYIILKKK